jgi:hypothetical protein
MMRGVQLEEDDITAVLLRILDARVRIFGWSVPDQSKGGYSAKGNPAEREVRGLENGDDLRTMSFLDVTGEARRRPPERPEHPRGAFGGDCSCPRA